jgi:hypothetical protein
MNFRTWLYNAFIGLRLTDWIIAAFTGVLAVVAVFQYREMKRAGDDTHVLAEQAVIQSKAALMQATMSQQTFDAVFHPSIEVSTVTFNQQAITENGIVSYTLKNVGAAPAEGLHVKVTVQTGNIKKDISPARTPSELGVGETFTDDPQVTTKSDTITILNGYMSVKLYYSIEYAAHGKPSVHQCTAFVLEPAKRELIPTGNCK